mgnify:CR=1
MFVEQFDYEIPRFYVSVPMR